MEYELEIMKISGGRIWVKTVPKINAGTPNNNNSTTPINNNSTTDFSNNNT